MTLSQTCKSLELVGVKGRVHTNRFVACSAIPTWTNSNIQAGVDTTSILESVILYYLLKNPTTLATLCEEVDKAAKAGVLTASSSPSETKVVSWKETQSLPYLEACINEASRLHPPISFPIERIVPAGPSLEIDGHIIPAGTRVSMVCPFVCYFSERVYRPSFPVLL